jgi:hypothetical protein
VKKHLFVIIWFFSLYCPVFADNGIESNTSVQLYVPTVGGASFGVLQDFILPLSTGNSLNPLTRNSNIALSIGLNVSPVSFNLQVREIWTPIPFFQLHGGIKTGIGWNYNDMFGKPQNGMGLYIYDNTKEPPEGVDGSGFDGVVWKAHNGAILQFDFAAISPGDWHHIIFKLNNEIQYQEFTKSKGGEYWYYHDIPGDGFYQNNALPQKKPSRKGGGYPKLKPRLISSRFRPCIPLTGGLLILPFFPVDAQELVRRRV